MGELLRDPVWQFVGAVLALLALIVTVGGLLYRTRKRLSYEIVTNTRLLTVDEEIEGRVKITFDDYPISGVRLLVIHVRNNGNVPIEESDYDRPLGFWVKGGPKVLTAEVTETRPSDLRARVEAFENSVYVEKTLLNPGDAFALRLLYTGDGPLAPVGRIRGVSEIRQKRKRTGSWTMFLSALALPATPIVGDRLGGQTGIFVAGALALLCGILLIAWFVRAERRGPIL